LQINNFQAHFFFAFGANSVRNRAGIVTGNKDFLTPSAKGFNRFHGLETSGGNAIVRIEKAGRSAGRQIGRQADRQAGKKPYLLKLLFALVLFRPVKQKKRRGIICPARIISGRNQLFRL
jgi:hypothetical protein